MGTENVSYLKKHKTGKWGISELFKSLWREVVKIEKRLFLFRRNLIKSAIFFRQRCFLFHRDRFAQNHKTNWDRKRLFWMFYCNGLDLLSFSVVKKNTFLGWMPKTVHTKQYRNKLSCWPKTNFFKVERTKNKSIGKYPRLVLKRFFFYRSEGD